jgi:PAS domain S-box-containing protein
MHVSRLPAVFGYLLAVLVTAGALVYRLYLAGVLGETGPLVPFALAVMVAAFYGGLRPGLFATGLGVLTALLLLPSSQGFSPERVGDLVRLAVFLAFGVIASWVCEGLRRYRRRAAWQADLLEHSGDAVLAWEPAGSVLYWNRGAERLYGFTRQEALGRVTHDLLATTFPVPLPAIVASLEQDGEWSGELTHRTKRGLQITVSSRMVLVREPNGRRVVLEDDRDVTGQLQAQKALKEADRRKDEFLATLAHELRNPLAPMRNALQILRRADNRAASEQARAVLERQLLQMVRLIDDLLDVSRVTRGKLRLRTGRVELAAVVASAVETARPLIEASGHELTVALPPGPVPLDVDLTRLAQVFANLLNNAAKYTERGGRIWLTAERQGSDVVVSVKDTGVGIAAEALPRLFEMFSQVDRSLEQSQGGLGIGLSLVKGLVEMHGGSVEARSEGPGRGSEFVVRLPVAVAGPEQEGTAPHSTSHATPVKRRILVVDDNRDSADTLAVVLTDLGNEVRTAFDGLEAVEAAAAFGPDVILLDIGLPKLNGYDACRRIRQQPGAKGIAIIAVTGYSQQEDRRRSLEAGFDQHLVKPVAVPALEQVLAEMVAATDRQETGRKG